MSAAMACHPMKAWTHTHTKRVSVHQPTSCRPVLCRTVKPSRIPGPQEDAEVMHEAFMHAYEASQPVDQRIPGIQQFAAAVWERRRHIPSQTYSDPLDHVFTEFDTDDDDKLSASEVTAALRSRGVEAEERLIARFIESVDKSGSHTVHRQQWADFIFHLANADLSSQGLPSAQQLLHNPESSK